jgi:hypothetical protein
MPRDEAIWFPDNFDEEADDARARNVSPARRLKVDTNWAELCRGKTIGKAVNFKFDIGQVGVGGNQAVNSSAFDILELRGQDDQATQFCVTLSPPEIFDGAAITANPQTLQGSYDNIGIVDIIPPGLVGGRVTNVRNNNEFANITAIVEWGAGGVQHRVEADFLNGLCLNLVGSYVRIRAFAEGNLISPGFDSAQFKVGATIGPGFAKPNTAQRTILMSSSAAINVESSVYSVPRYAKSVHLCGANAVHDTYVGAIRFYRGPNVAVNNLFVADYVFAGNTPGPIPIPNGAWYFTFVPGIANNLSNMAVFQLAI